MEFTPNSVIIRDLESGAIIATRVVDHASRLYSFSDFGPIDEVDSSYVDDSDFEENFGHLNLGILTCDPVLEPCISSPPIDITPPITLDDVASATVLPSCDLVQQDISCLPTSVHWDAYLIDIASLFVDSYIADLGDIIVTFIFSLMKMILL